MNPFIEITFWNLLSIIPPLIIIEGIFSGSEIALLSADKTELKKKIKNGQQGAQLAVDLLENSERIFSTTLLITSVCVVTVSGIIALFVLQENYPYGPILSIAISSSLVVVFGELIPKTIYQRYATQLAPLIAFPVTFCFWLFYPITKIISSYNLKLTKLINPVEYLITGRKRTTREELQSLISYGKKESEIRVSEKRMIKRIFDFKDTEAKHALIPLVKVDAIEENSTVRQAIEMFQKHRHSRMPVFSERVDKIVGNIEIFDLFTVTDLDQAIRHFISPTHFVAETQTLEDVLVEMHRKRSEMSVVVDEYGGAMGILTYEDIVEEVVGEINDEYDSEQSTYRQIEDGCWMIQARMEIQQINEIIKIAVPEGEYETLGGFLLQQFGRIPKVRDELHFTTSTGNYRFVIRQANEKQIQQVFIEKLTQ